MLKARKNELFKSIEVLAVKAAYTYEHDAAIKAVKVIKKTLKCSKNKAVSIFIDEVDNTFCSIEYDGTRVSGFEVLRDPEYSRYCGCVYDSVLSNYYYFRD